MAPCSVLAVMTGSDAGAPGGSALVLYRIKNSACRAPPAATPAAGASMLAHPSVWGAMHQALLATRRFAAPVLTTSHPPGRSVPPPSAPAQWNPSPTVAYAVTDPLRVPLPLLAAHCPPYHPPPPRFPPSPPPHRPLWPLRESRAQLAQTTRRSRSPPHSFVRPSPGPAARRSSADTRAATLPPHSWGATALASIPPPRQGGERPQTGTRRGHAAPHHQKQGREERGLYEKSGTARGEVAKLRPSRWHTP